MKISKFKKDDSINIKWLDTYDPDLSAWANDEEILSSIKKTENIAIAKSRGYFYCKDKNYIYIYGDKVFDMYSRVAGIPINCIIEISKGR
jgi:hypothetical protein